MDSTVGLLGIAGSFIVIALASKEIGRFFSTARLPLISGFLFAGIIAGPFVLELIPVGAVEHLRFVDEVSLAFIAFAAGSELYLREIRSRLNSIAWVTTGLVLATFSLGSLTVFLLSDLVPFMQSMSITGRIAVALMAGSILVARSPSSAIAIINELRAKGPFTQTAMGVTVVMDVVVILLFGLNSSVAGALLTDVSFNLGFIALLLAELLLSLLVSYALFRALLLILGSHLSPALKASLVLLAGYSVFLLSAWLRIYSHEHWAFEVLLEPLLICMIGSFLVTNFSRCRDDFMHILHDVGPPIYIAFFTLTGASLALDVLVKTWSIALILFFVRLVSIFIGSFLGGTAARDPAKHNRISWMGYVTQAGVGLGLAKEVAVEFPDWGTAFATVIIAVIVLNQIAGPPFFKWAINRVGESHTRAPTHEFDGIRDALVFGLKAESLTLARQLERHDWQVKLVCVREKVMEELITPEVDIHVVNDLSLETLRQLEAANADAIVCFLSDDESYQVCELAYEHFGTETMVVRLRDRANIHRFDELGALVVEPQTAIVSLLEHMVRSPAGTSILLGMDEEQDVVDVEVRDPSLHGMALRDLRLPLDVLVLTIHRNGHTLLSRGHVQFELGDKVTMVGPTDKLEEVMLRFDA
jgi:Trk K+ transport system NAD-binding subunit/Kef-type K+ transport system membrane component KefB